MAYLRPPAFQRKVFNKLAMKFGVGGSATLVVRGRRSGNDVAVPVIPVDYAGARYVVSTRGESQWVRNLRAGGKAELRSKGKSEQLTATEVPLADRPPIIEAYRAKAGKTVTGYWKKLPEPVDHPVFKVEAGGG
jgi:deazaflavin-dependent oxidoreductase (nitroreductase family)